MIRDENGMLAGYVYVDITGRDVGGYVAAAKQAAAVARGLLAEWLKKGEAPPIVVPVWHVPPTPTRGTRANGEAALRPAA